MPLLNEYMKVLFDQGFNKSAPEITGQPYGFIRDLEQIWKSNECQKLSEKFDFDQKNTLMLESDEINVHECHENSLIIDRYTREDVWPTELEN